MSILCFRIYTFPSSFSLFQSRFLSSPFISNLSKCNYLIACNYHMRMRRGRSLSTHHKGIKSSWRAAPRPLFLHFLRRRFFFLSSFLLRRRELVYQWITFPHPCIDRRRLLSSLAINYPADAELSDPISFLPTFSCGWTSPAVNEARKFWREN